jgi:hypothetical protein
MDAPRCRICGTRHWLSEPCKALAVAEPVAAVTAIDQVRPRVRRKAKRGTFDRTAYQREYMRKWRARRAGKKASVS